MAIIISLVFLLYFLVQRCCQSCNKHCYTYIYPYMLPLFSIQRKIATTRALTNSGQVVILPSTSPSTKTVLHDTFGLQRSFLNHSANDSSYLQQNSHWTPPIEHTCQSVLHIIVFFSSQKHFIMLCSSTRATHSNTQLKNSDGVCFISQTSCHCQCCCVSLCVQLMM